MIKCEHHGFQPGVQISPDLEKFIKEASPLQNIIVLKYEYREEITNEFYLSEFYANQHGISEDIILPLPDDYPDYIQSTVMVCEKCFIDCVPGYREL